ncbi:hypothetical protein ARMSODRAFT_980861 [Armillaria solidipes]|uniref:Uncharacterized protein n=1 Tax=Armillaria solidipes TaxID=1076256 RepID=A0A2H3AZZ4_9AGAR|nr:hypothetical protein ARMSODRAFT_980861 [Armillaria solidipes]
MRAPRSHTIKAGAQNARNCEIITLKSVWRGHSTSIGEKKGNTHKLGELSNTSWRNASFGITCLTSCSVVDNLSSSYENHYSPTNVAWSILDAILFGTWSNQSMKDTERTAPDGGLQKGPVRRLGVLRTYRGVYVKPGTSRRGEDCAMRFLRINCRPIQLHNHNRRYTMGKWCPTVIMGIAFSGVQTRREQDGSSDLEKRRPDDVALKAWCRSTGYSLVGLSERVDVCIPQRSDLGPR